MRLRLLSTEEAREAAAELDDEQREYLAAVAQKLGPEMDGDEVQDLLYSTAVERGSSPRGRSPRSTPSCSAKERSQGRAVRRRVAPELVRERFS